MRWYRRLTSLTRQPFINARVRQSVPCSTVPKFRKIPSYLQPSFLSSSHHYATESSYRQVKYNEDEINAQKVDFQILSTGNIRPASPTPNHLRSLKLSVLDQFQNNFYTPLIIFFPNTDNMRVSDVVSIRSRHLKESLSKLLTQYYPFAGEIKDEFHIDCNDKGVYFVEAQVNETLEAFLRQPNDQKVRELIPRHPTTTESSFENYVTSVQVNIFSCGGIGLVTTLTHKIVDGHSYFTFINAWAAATRGSSEIISPSFLASEIFPYIPSSKYSWPSKFWTTKLRITKRFVFNSKALASLKAQPVPCNGAHASPPSRGPTRTEATTALIWKAAAKAASIVRPFSPQSPHALLSMVNIRKRASPPWPDESIGNLIIPTVSVCFPNKQLDLPTLMSEIRESIAKINSDLIEAIKGEKREETIYGVLMMVNSLADMIGEGDLVFTTSLLNSGIYEIDFGWGKPIWFYHMNPGISRFLSLNDMIKGGGVEAIVTLSHEEMEIFERDTEVLSYTTPSPSPLEFLK